MEDKSQGMVDMVLMPRKLTETLNFLLFEAVYELKGKSQVDIMEIYLHTSLFFRGIT